MNPLAEIQTIVDSGIFVLIWLVQLVIYPSFAVIEEEHFYVVPADPDFPASRCTSSGM